MTTPLTHDERAQLRDTFATAAITGLAARLTQDDVADLSSGSRRGKMEAQAAYALADAMIAARAR